MRSLSILGGALLSVLLSGCHAQTQPGSNLKTNADGLRQHVKGVEFELIKIPSGEFQMGSPNGNPDERPVHRVVLKKDFQMGKYHVTVRQFRSFVETTGYQTDAEKEEWAYRVTSGAIEKSRGTTWRNPGFTQEEQEPVVCVSWYDAVAFCQWMSEETGDEYRLPTEAEWEYAARAGSVGDYGGELDQMAWYANNAGRNPLATESLLPAYGPDYLKQIYQNGNRTHPVGQKEPNAWGLYDIVGNAWHWVKDWYDKDYYSRSPGTNPQGPSSGSERLNRGGSWFNTATSSRSANRDKFTPKSRAGDVSFRLVRIVK